MAKNKRRVEVKVQAVLASLTDLALVGSHAKLSEQAFVQIRDAIQSRVEKTLKGIAPYQPVTFKLDPTPAEPREPTDGDRLAEMVRAFAAAMTEKLLEKCEEGWEGWDTMGGEEAAAMAGRLIEHADRALSQPRQWVDVANFAAMLWWRRIGEHRAVMAESQEKKS